MARVTNVVRSVARWPGDTSPTVTHLAFTGCGFDTLNAARDTLIDELKACIRDRLRPQLVAMVTAEHSYYDRHGIGGEEPWYTVRVYPAEGGDDYAWIDGMRALARELRPDLIVSAFADDRRLQLLCEERPDQCYALDFRFREAERGIVFDDPEPARVELMKHVAFLPELVATLRNAETVHDLPMGPAPNATSPTTTPPEEP